MARGDRGAILTGPDEPPAIEPIVVERPGPGEVMIRLAASGVCHTDLHVQRTRGWGLPFPILLGHEGAGVVEEIGEGVADLAPGDPVVIAWRAPCGACRACRRGDPRHCWTPLRAGPRLRRARGGAVLTPVLRCGTFATRTVVHSRAAVKVPSAMPLERACLLGCSVMTGVGAVVHTSPVWPGSRVAVIGCGAVGLSVIQGARLRGAARIIAVDVSPPKLDWATRLGATDAVDAREGEVAMQVRELCEGEGVDFAFEAVGRPECVRQAVEMLCYAGTATLLGLPAPDAAVTLDLGGPDRGVFPRGISLRVSRGGDCIPSEDVPRLAALYLEGALDLDAMVTREITLDDVEDAFRQIESGQVIRSVIRMRETHPAG